MINFRRWVLSFYSREVYLARLFILSLCLGFLRTIKLNFIYVERRLQLLNWFFHLLLSIYYLFSDLHRFWWLLTFSVPQTIISFQFESFFPQVLNYFFRKVYLRFLTHLFSLIKLRNTRLWHLRLWIDPSLKNRPYWFVINISLLFLSCFH